MHLEVRPCIVTMCIIIIRVMSHACFFYPEQQHSSSNKGLRKWGFHLFRFRQPLDTMRPE